MIIEKNPKGELFFAINDTVNVPTDNTPPEASSIGILWDSSM